MFEQESVPFFYGLFTDEDSDYIGFHQICLKKLTEHLQQKGSLINKRFLRSYLKDIESGFTEQSNPTFNSLLHLLRVFIEKITADYAFLSNEDKLNFIKETFENNGLKQYLQFVDTNIILSTVHGAKGLEWDFVLLPDMEQYSFPNWPSLCGACQFKRDCDLIITTRNEDDFLDELSVFYVAVTRAKRQVHFSASKTRIANNGSEGYCNISCLLRIPGLRIE
jgi:DNA helicase-2/ATP-dependent DNA helicase PcrA